MGSRLMKLILFFVLLLPVSLLSQSEGGFGYRRFSNTTTLNNTSVSNSNTSASRNAYVHSNGLYYVWDGNSWEREENIDTFGISGTTISISLYGDGVPVKTLSIADALATSGVDSTFIRTNGSYLNKRITTPVGRYAPTGFGTIGQDTSGVVNVYTRNTQAKPGLWVSGDTLEESNWFFEFDPPDYDNIPDLESFVFRGARFEGVNPDPRPNYVFVYGYNFAENGTQFNSDEPSIGVQYETYFVLGGEGNVEHHEYYIDTTGTQHRYTSFAGQLSGESDQYSITTDNLNYNQGSGSSVWQVRPLTNLFSFTDTTGLRFEEPRGFATSVKNGANNAYLTLLDFNGSDTLEVGRSNLPGVKITPMTIFLHNKIYPSVGAKLQIGSASAPGRRVDLRINQSSTEALEMNHTSGTWKFTNSGGIFTITDNSSVPSAYFYGGSAAQTFLLRGNAVGIGMTVGDTPGAKLHVESSSGATASLVAIENTTGYNVLFRTNATPEAAITGVQGDFAYSNISSTGRWWGKQTGTGNTGWVEFYHTGNLPAQVNIFNSDGTQDDADREFTVDSSQTLAIGWFPNFPSDTWGRGLFYDPETTDGVVLQNVDIANTYVTRLELDDSNGNLGSTHSTSSAYFNTTALSQIGSVQNVTSRTSSTYGDLHIVAQTNANEEIVAMTQFGKGTAVTNSVYLGDGYAGSQYAQYTDRAYGVQSILASGPFDWFQILLPNTATDSTGNNISFYNRKYFWSNEQPSTTNLDTSVHVWIGNGTTTTPDFINLADFVTSYSQNIYNSDGTMQTGGSDVTMSAVADNIRMTMSTGNTTTREMLRMHTVENAVTRYLVLTSPVDSFRLYRTSTGKEFGFQTFGGTSLRMTSDSIVSFLADSILYVEGTVQSVVTSRFLLGLTNNNYLKRYDGDAATSGAFLKSNGTDWTYADFLSTYSNATEATSAFTATSADTDLNFAIIPKGNGALTTDVPDGGTGGGNARGTGAIDLQTTRDAATQVASADYSAILGGRRNTVSAAGAATVGGADNIVTGQGSVVIGGYTSSSVGGANLVTTLNGGTWGLQDTATGTANAYAIGSQCVASANYSIATNTYARAYLYGQNANAGTTFTSNTPGTAQSSYLIMSRQITGTAQTELFLDGSTIQAILLGTNRGWNFKVDVVGICTVAGAGGLTAGDSWSSWHVGGIKRLNTTTSLVGTVQTPATAQSDAAMATTVVTIDADNGTEALRVRITPPITSDANTVTRWVATISLTEAAY